MEIEQIRTTLTQIFSDVFKREMVLTDDLSAKDVPEWTSLTNMTIIFKIEETFGIKVKLKDLMAWQCVGDMIKTINAKVNGN